ncbi:MAG: GNAT family N-acetyltransferase [Actinomycetota bacterium]
MEIRILERDELARVGEIDRTERIEVLFEQNGTELVASRGVWNAPAWNLDGHGEHSVSAQHETLLRNADAGGIALGVFSNDRLVGIGVVVLHIRPAMAQLAYLHVSRRSRSAGIGRSLSLALERIAHRAGDTEIVVSATPSENTVRFYLGRGYQPMEQPLPELLELEPEDIHMGKQIRRSNHRGSASLSGLLQLHDQTPAGLGQVVGFDGEPVVLRAGGGPDS